MKNLKHCELTGRLHTVCALMLMTVFSFTGLSCSEDEDENGGEPYFELEEGKTSFEGSSGKSEYIVTVRSNCSWNVVKKDVGADWVRPFPAEGDKDGRFKLIVQTNETFTARSAQFAMMVGDVEYPILLNVSQEAAVPSISVGDGSGTVKVGSDAGEFSITSKANVEWHCRVDQAAESWLQIVSVGEDGMIYLHAEKNTGIERTGILHCISDEQPSANIDITVIQAAGSVILQEDFSWLAYGQLDGVIDPPFTTDRQKRMDLWTDDEKAHGWTSTIVGNGGGNTPLVYACYGYLKLGKTSWAGDLISPKLNLQNASNVKVTFKAMGYVSAGGTRDDNVLYVSVIGPGTVVSEANPFIIENYPNSNKVEHGPDYDPWSPDIAERTFQINGATGETQIKFMAGKDYSLGTSNKNRIFLDDITVSMQE